MAQTQTKKIVLCALLTAIITVSTIVIQIPMPISGYVNFGDVFVLTAAFILGAIYGAIAAGVGSMLADIITGYAIFAPATLIIKALMAIVAFYSMKMFKKTTKIKVFHYVISGVFAELIMVIGYFVYSALLMGEGLVAATSIPGNLIQGAVGVAVATIVMLALSKTKIINQGK